MSTPNAFRRNLHDAGLLQAVALHNGAGTTTSSGIDTGLRTARAVAPDVEFEVIIPRVVVGIAPNTTTLVATIEMDADPAFGSPTAIQAKTYTAAGGAGIAADNWRVQMPIDCEQYVRLKVVAADGPSSGTFGDASALTAQLAILASQFNC